MGLLGKVISESKMTEGGFLQLKKIVDEVGLGRRTVLEWLARAAKNEERCAPYKELRGVPYGKDIRGRWYIHKDAIPKFKKVKEQIILIGKTE